MNNIPMEHFEIKEDILPIKIQITKYKDSMVGQIVEVERLKGCIVGGKTEEEIKKGLMGSFKCMLAFDEYVHKQYNRTSIFRGNKSGNQLWFTIVGLGMVFYYRPKSMDKYSKPKHPFHIGRLYLRFTNEWKKRN